MGIHRKRWRRRKEKREKERQARGRLAKGRLAKGRGSQAREREGVRRRWIQITRKKRQWQPKRYVATLLNLHMNLSHFLLLIGN